jgi:uncharacterized protein (DUF433 family)
MNARELIEIDKEKLGGTPVFVGTRVPIKSLFDYLESGETIDEFLNQFPSVTREQVRGVLEASQQTLLTSYEVTA